MKHTVLFILFFFAFSAIYAQELSDFDSTINANNKLPDSKEKVDAYNKLMWDIKYVDFDTSVYFGNQALKIAKELNYNEGSALANKNLGGVYYFRNSYTKAYEYYTESLNLYVLLNDSSGISKITRNIGSVFHQQGNYSQAVGYFLRSLDIRKALNDTIGIADIHNALGTVYMEQGQLMYPKAKNSFQNALLLFQKKGDQKGMAQAYFRIGATYISNENPQYDSAVYFYNKSLKITDSIKDLRTTAQIYEGLGVIAKQQEKYDQAMEFFSKCIEISEQMENQFLIASCELNIAQIYLGKENNQQALKYCLNAIKIAEKHDISSQKLSGYNCLMNIYNNMGNYNQAYEYSILYINLQDSIQGIEMKKALSKMEDKHEFDKILQQKEQEKEKMELTHKAESKRQKLVTIFFIVGFVLVLMFAFSVLRGYNQKRKANNLLSEKNSLLQQQKEEIEAQRDEIELRNNQLVEKNFEISEKNITLEQQKEEIEAQRDEIEAQRDTVILHKEEIEKQKQQITDSIIYAKRIQSAILPPIEMLNLIFPENFVLYRPRDIVSGDFYWSHSNQKFSILAVADCTGHGVPGAMMSMLGMSLLNEIISHLSIEKINAALMLNKLREYVKKSLRQTGKANEAKDGMDIALCVYDKELKQMNFAGANNPLLQISNGEIIQHKGDKMPIGIHISEKESFENQVIEVKEGDLFYMFSDGYVDQFGGPAGKKFMIKNFRELLLKIHQNPLEVQKEIINQTLEEFMHGNNVGKEYEQIDDISVIGFRII